MLPIWPLWGKPPDVYRLKYVFSIPFWRACEGQKQRASSPFNLSTLFRKGDRKGGPDVLNPSQGSQFCYFVVEILYCTDGSRVFLGLFPSSPANRFFRLRGKKYCTKSKRSNRGRMYARISWFGNRKGNRECIKLNRHKLFYLYIICNASLSCMWNEGI